MRRIHYVTLGFLAVAGLAGGPARANVCQAETTTCGTAMPIDGYCECKTHGTTEGGTVVAKAMPHGQSHPSAAMCSAHPNTPGCS